MPTTDSPISPNADATAETPPGVNMPSPKLDPLVRQHAAVLAFGRRTNARPSMTVLIQDAGALLAEILDTDLSGVARVSSRGDRLALKVGTSDTSGKVSTVADHEYPLSAEESMAGYALNSAAPVVASDLAAEKRYVDRFLRKSGVVGALTVPLHVDNTPFGTLAVYSKQQREFTEDDVEFAETIAHLLVSSIARERAEQALEQQRNFSSAVLELVDELVLVLDREGRLLDMNRACQQTSGFSLEAVRGESFLELFALPEELDQIKKTLRQAAAGDSPHNFESRLVTKDGSQRHVSWSLKPIGEVGEENGAVVLTGTDHTERLAVEEQLRQAKAAMEKLAGEDGRSQPFQVVGSKRGRELRSSPRRAYKYRQLIAPMYGGTLPTRDKFFKVDCGDISAGGISFYLSNPPEFKELVVALGQAPTFSYFSGRVVHVGEQEVDGEKTYLVGCHFTGRLHF